MGEVGDSGERETEGRLPEVRRGGPYGDIGGAA